MYVYEYVDVYSLYNDSRDQLYFHYQNLFSFLFSSLISRFQNGMPQRTNT